MCRYTNVSGRKNSFANGLPGRVEELSQLGFMRLGRQSPIKLEKSK